VTILVFIIDLTNCVGGSFGCKARFREKRISFSKLEILVIEKVWRELPELALIIYGPAAIFLHTEGAYEIVSLVGPISEFQLRQHK